MEGVTSGPILKSRMADIFTNLLKVAYYRKQQIHCIAINNALCIVYYLFPPYHMKIKQTITKFVHLDNHFKLTESKGPSQWTILHSPAY